MLSTQSDNCIPINFVHISDITSLFAAEFEEPKFGISGNGLKQVVPDTGLIVVKKERRKNKSIKMTKQDILILSHFLHQMK